MRLNPNPGMFTHRSRGMESIPAVFETGSTVSRLDVSIQKGRSASSGSQPRNPTNKILILLAPFQVGYVISSSLSASGVEVGNAFVVTRTGSSTALTCGPAQLVGGIPGRDVSRQQTVRSRTNEKRPTAMTNIIPQKTRNRIGKRGDADAVSGTLKFSHVSMDLPISVHNV